MGEGLESVVNRFCLTTNGLRSPRNHTIPSGRGRNLILNSLSSVVRNRGSFAKSGNLRHWDYWDYFPLFDGMQPRKLMSDMRGMRGKSREAQVSERDPTSVVMDVTRC